jgi:hypothetical protein
MKKLFLTFLSLSLNLISNAQTFSIISDTLEETYLANQETYIYSKNEITNATNSTIDLSFEVISNTIPDAGWTAILKTSYFCFYTISGSYNFGNIEPNNQDFLKVGVNFNNIPGDGEIRFKVYETSNPSNADTMTFIYHVTSTADINDSDNIQSISLFPNPASENILISISEQQTNSFVSIFDLNGKELITQSISPSNNRVNIVALPEGMYFYEISKNGKVIYRSKFSKI